MKEKNTVVQTEEQDIQLTDEEMAKVSSGNDFIPVHEKENTSSPGTFEPGTSAPY